MESRQLVIFSLVFLISFPVLAYSLTTISATEFNAAQISSLDPQNLAAAGITITDGIEANCTYGMDWYNMDFGEQGIYRVRWYNLLGFGDRFRLQKQSNPFDRFTNNWLFPSECHFRDPSTQELVHPITNATIIQKWRTDYNWTMFNVNEEAITLFIAYNSTSYASIEDALDGGQINVVLASFTDNTGSASSFDFFKVGNWFSRLLIGDEAFGLPDVFQWTIRIMTGIFLLAAIWFVRDLIPL